MTIDPQLALTCIGIIGTGGVAWGSVKVALNGTRDRVKKIEVLVERHVADDVAVQLQTVRSLTRIETAMGIKSDDN